MLGSLPASTMNLNRIHERREGTDYLSSSLSLPPRSYHYENHRLPFTTHGIIHHRPWNNERSFRWLLKMDNPFTSFPFDHVRNIHSFLSLSLFHLLFFIFPKNNCDPLLKRSTNLFIVILFLLYNVRQVSIMVTQWSSKVVIDLTDSKMPINGSMSRSEL